MADQSEEETSSGEDQLVSNKVDLRRKKGLDIKSVQPLLFLVSYMAEKNSFVVRQIDVPFDKVNSMFCCQATMQIKMIFQMTKETFNSVCCWRYF